MIERESYAIMVALLKWHDIIFGSHITMWCDHNPLTYIVSCAPKISRLTRWALALQQYNLTLKNRRLKVQLKGTWWQVRKKQQTCGWPGVLRLIIVLNLSVLCVFGVCFKAVFVLSG